MCKIIGRELCRVHWHPSWGFVLPAAVVKMVIQQHDSARIIGFEFYYNGESKAIGVEREGLIHSFDDIPLRVQKKIWKGLWLRLHKRFICNEQVYQEQP